ncbi:MAG: type I methionyl aminopeptidase [Candidatus Paceibacterota bacterium]|jgi:methionyl aminopeptidase
MIELKTSEEIKIMAEGGRRLAEVLTRLKSEIIPGVTTKSLDKLSRELIRATGSTPAFLGYRPRGAKRAYPATICSSINDIVVHGLPKMEHLKEGDIISIDVGLKYKGFYLDAAFTAGVGEISAEAKKLISITEQTLREAIKETKPGKRLGDIGHAVQSLAEKNNFSVVRSLTGHGIGRQLHEDPNVFNFGRPKSGEPLEIGMVIAIEPMLSAAPPPDGGKIRTLSDDSFATLNGSLAAHFEHTVAITKKGPQILTKI